MLHFVFETAPTNKLNPKNLRIVLLLQGGGALGAYQAGVYQALHENGLVPDWVIGTSIGAINAALIAGNQAADRLSRLKQFWDRVSRSDTINPQHLSDLQRRSNVWLSTIGAVLRGVPGFFKPRLMSLFPAGLAVPPERASFYDTEPLAETLEELIDFDYLNAPGGIHLTVNAMKVTTGELVSFDSTRQALKADHIRASGALPPGFPAVRIDGDLYWDGGLYSNTPLANVLEEPEQIDTLCFMVDLWNPNGPEPTTLDEIGTRQKDVMFASRSARHIADYLSTYQLKRKLRKLNTMLAPNKKSAVADELVGLCCDHTIHVVRLSYRGRDWHMASKDVNFSRGSIEWRWDLGYQDALRAIQQVAWLAQVEEGIGLVVHDLPPLVQTTSAAV